MSKCGRAGAHRTRLSCHVSLGGWPMKFEFCTRRRFYTLLATVTLFLAPLAMFSQSIPQITQAVDPAQRKVLGGTVHPLTKVASDQGSADAGLAMKDMLLV